MERNFTTGPTSKKWDNEKFIELLRENIKRKKSRRAADEDENTAVSRANNEESIKKKVKYELIKLIWYVKHEHFS